MSPIGYISFSKILKTHHSPVETSNTKQQKKRFWTMKGFLSIFLLISVVLAVTNAYRSPVQKPKPNKPGFPTFPGQGPFNPHVKPYPVRIARSPKKRGHIKVEAQKNGGQSSYNVDLGHEIYKNKHGSISVNAGVNKDPYSKPQSHVGIQGSFKF